MNASRKSMLSRLREAIVASGEVLPEAALRLLLRRALEGYHLTLCAHRVAARRRPDELEPQLTTSPDTLDRLICLLLSARPTTSERWLTVTFDDGYEDSARYIEERAPLFPEVEWIFFVCPEKVERQVGFRVDLLEHIRRTRGEELDPARFLSRDLDVLAENQREDLRAVAGLPDYRLADVELCLRLQRLPNVALGNHTNCHFESTQLSLEQVRLEYERSWRDFTRLFGPQRHFAFPFGSPELAFSPEHVEEVRALAPCVLWTTERRPYLPRERQPGAVLPRLAVSGTGSYKQNATSIAVQAFRFRRQGTPHRYPPATGARPAPEAPPTPMDEPLGVPSGGN